MTMITPSYLGETIEYSSLHACRSTLEDPTQVSSNDRTIDPNLERFLAKRMNATTVELASSHLSLISHSKAIADLILAAAG